MQLVVLQDGEDADADDEDEEPDPCLEFRVNGSGEQPQHEQFSCHRSYMVVSAKRGHQYNIL